LREQESDAAAGLSALSDSLCQCGRLAVRPPWAVRLAGALRAPASRMRPSGVGCVVRWSSCRPGRPTETVTDRPDYLRAARAAEPVSADRW